MISLDKQKSWLFEEYLEGRSLYDYIQSSDFDRREAMEIFRRVGEVVGYDHSRGLYHGDLTDENNRILDENKILLIDLEDSGLVEGGIESDMRPFSHDIKTLLLTSLGSAVSYDMYDGEVNPFVINPDFLESYPELMSAFMEGYSSQFEASQRPLVVSTIEDANKELARSLSVNPGYTEYLESQGLTQFYIEMP